MNLGCGNALNKVGAKDHVFPGIKVSLIVKWGMRFVFTKIGLIYKRDAHRIITNKDFQEWILKNQYNMLKNSNNKLKKSMEFLIEIFKKTCKINKQILFRILNKRYIK